jgi:hypothetical protein
LVTPIWRHPDLHIDILSSLGSAAYCCAGAVLLVAGAAAASDATGWLETVPLPPPPQRAVTLNPRRSESFGCCCACTDSVESTFASLAVTLSDDMMGPTHCVDVDDSPPPPAAAAPPPAAAAAAAVASASAAAVADAVPIPSRAAETAFFMSRKAAHSNVAEQAGYPAEQAAHPRRVRRIYHRPSSLLSQKEAAG